MGFVDWESQFIKQLNLDKKDRALIRLCYKDNVDPHEIAAYFDGLIFEACQYDLCCLIALMCSKHNYAGTPEPLIPKIKGLVRYLASMNACRIVELFNFIKEVNQADIPIMLTKGAALRVWYYPKTIRYMADTDVYVAGKDFGRTVQLAKDYGCEGILDFHSIDLKKGPLAVDVHRVFVKELLNGANPDGIWDRAIKASKNGVSFYIPSREDIVLQILVTAFYNVLETSWDKDKKHVKWIIDILPFLLDEEKIDWEKLVMIAEQLKISDQIKTMINALGDILPQSINTEKVLGYFSGSEVNQKAIQLFHKLCKIYSVQCEYEGVDSKTPGVIFYWAKKTWINSLYLHGYENWFRAAIHYPQFCAITMRIGGVKEIPGELIRRIQKRARAKRLVRGDAPNPD